MARCGRQLPKKRTESGGIEAVGEFNGRQDV